MGPPDFVFKEKHHVVLAGSGLSSVPPTSLPDWWELNDAVLGALGGAVERLTGAAGLISGFRDEIRRRRETTPFLKPDLQAQLMEDELGPSYFLSLTCLSAIATNPAHKGRDREHFGAKPHGFARS